ncbi:MAG: metallophosphoesterase [Candidatus Lokiarchaeota archaeon]|nr:metallophosphoesterase [Candidatus Lokiarchaeota archaeon]
MKICLITDTHFCFKKSNKVYHDYFEKFYNEVFFPTLDDRGIDCVVHLGDAFDNRKGVDYWGLEWAQRVFYDRLLDKDIQLYQICGNHDAEKKTTNKYNSIDTLLRDYSNIIRITEPVEHTIDELKCLFIPWICKDNEQITFDVLKSSNAKVIFGHLELSGFSLFPGFLQTHGLSTEKFQKYDRVFSGHYHARSNDGKIYYLGNPYQMFWSDVDDVRGFHIFDTDTYELEFIENPNNLFCRIYYNDIDYKTFDSSVVQNKNVKIVIQQKSNQSEYDRFINEMLKQDIIDLKIVETIDVNDDLVNISDLNCEDTLSTLNKYVEQSDFKLDKTAILKILYDTYKDALELEV